MERNPRSAYTGDGREDWARLVTETDMNNQKVKENNPPSFRPAEVGGPGRRLVGSNRTFGNAILEDRGEFTPLTQPTAWREREKKKKRKRKSRARMIKMGEGDPRSTRVDLRHSSVSAGDHWKSRKNSRPRPASLRVLVQQKLPSNPPSGAEGRPSDDNHLSDHLASATSRIGPLLELVISGGLFCSRTRLRTYVAGELLSRMFVTPHGFATLHGSDHRHLLFHYCETTSSQKHVYRTGLFFRVRFYSKSSDQLAQAGYPPVGDDIFTVEAGGPCATVPPLPARYLVPSLPVQNRLLRRTRVCPHDPLCSGKWRPCSGTLAGRVRPEEGQLEWPG